jgi:DNA polymerase III subunit gamma/tau
MLHIKYRPTDFDEFLGNASTVQVLEKELSKEKPIHAYLFTGPPGCGKTTLGRIVAKRLGCKGNDFREIDSADFRGIDTVREIRKQSQFLAMEGERKVWLLDEVHKLSNDAMNALLKALEDPPDHVYYVLCTTDPQKLIETVKDRCQQLKVGPLSDAEMKKLIRTVVKAEGESLQKNIYDQICQDSQGRPRAALQILTKVLCVPAESRLEVAQKAAEEQSQVIELCRALMSASGWKKIANILVGLKNQDPETIRRGVLGYCQAILLKGEENDQAAAIMEEMLTPFYSSGFPELTFACYSIMHPPSNEDGIPF